MVFQNRHHVVHIGFSVEQTNHIGVAPQARFARQRLKYWRIVGILKSDRNGTASISASFRSSAFAPVVFSFSWIKAWQNSLFISSQNGSLRDGCTETVSTRKPANLVVTRHDRGSPGTEYSASRYGYSTPPTIIALARLWRWHVLQRPSTSGTGKRLQPTEGQQIQPDDHFWRLPGKQQQRTENQRSPPTSASDASRFALIRTDIQIEIFNDRSGTLQQLGVNCRHDRSHRCSQEDPGGKRWQHFTINVGITRSGTVRSGSPPDLTLRPDAYRTSGLRLQSYR